MHCVKFIYYLKTKQQLELNSLFESRALHAKLKLEYSSRNSSWNEFFVKHKISRKDLKTYVFGLKMYVLRSFREITCFAKYNYDVIFSEFLENTEKFGVSIFAKIRKEFRLLQGLI